MFLCVLNDLPICFPWVFYNVLKVPNEFPKIVPNITSLVWGQFPHFYLQVGKEEIPSPHKNLYFEKTFKFQFLFFWSWASQNGPQQEKRKR
jgi:hypothetical protein